MPVTVQKILRSSVLAVAFLPVLALAACGGEGSGSNTQPYTNIPYTMERTAGKGVEYVRGAMLPAKEVKTEPMIQVTEPVKVAPEPITAGDKVFEHKQAK